MRTFVIQSNRGVEQLVARRAHNPEAGGSSPSPATKKTDVEKSASVFFIFLPLIEVLIMPQGHSDGYICLYCAR